jgi:hypothetical protein
MERTRRGRITAIVDGPTSGRVAADSYRIGGYCYGRHDRCHPLTLAWPLKTTP